jgi:hypothetical protein
MVLFNKRNNYVSNIFALLLRLLYKKFILYFQNIFFDTNRKKLYAVHLIEEFTKKIELLS